MPGTRVCARCGKGYWRRQLLEVWNTRNPGHRDGWSKTRIPLCLDCQDPLTTTRMLDMAAVGITGSNGDTRIRKLPKSTDMRRRRRAASPERERKSA